MSDWKRSKQKCTKIKCETSDGESMEFEVCIRDGKNVKCNKVK